MVYLNGDDAIGVVGEDDDEVYVDALISSIDCVISVSLISDVWSWDSRSKTLAASDLYLKSRSEI